MGVKIDGYSDDLICVMGDVSEEFDCFRAAHEGDEMYVGLSDGSLFAVEWKRGVWRFAPVVMSHSNHFTITQAPEDDEDNYTDVVQTDPDGEKITWVTFSTKMATAR